MASALLPTLLLAAHTGALDVTLDWRAPASCPSREEVEAQLAALVAPGARGAGEARVEVIDGGYRLSLEVRTDALAWSRRLEGPRCDSLATAAAVVIAVAVDPMAAAQRSETTLVPLPPASSPSAPPPSRTQPRVRAADLPPRPPTSSRRAMEAVVFEADGGVGVGPLPRPHAWAGGGAGLRWPRVEAVLRGEHRFAQLASRGQGGGAAVSLSSAGLWVGPVVRDGRWSAYLHGGLEVGAMVGRGRDLDRTRTAVSPWLGLGVQPGVRWAPAPWVALRAALTLEGSILRPSYSTNGGEIFYETAALGVRVAAGAEFRVPLDQSRRSRRPRD